MAHMLIDALIDSGFISKLNKTDAIDAASPFIASTAVCQAQGSKGSMVICYESEVKHCCGCATELVPTYLCKNCDGFCCYDCPSGCRWQNKYTRLVKQVPQRLQRDMDVILESLKEMDVSFEHFCIILAQIFTFALRQYAECATCLAMSTTSNVKRSKSHIDMDTAEDVADICVGIAKRLQHVVDTMKAHEMRTRVYYNNAKHYVSMVSALDPPEPPLHSGTRLVADLYEQLKEPIRKLNNDLFSDVDWTDTNEKIQVLAPYPEEDGATDAPARKKTKYT